MIVYHQPDDPKGKHRSGSKEIKEFKNLFNELNVIISNLPSPTPDVLWSWPSIYADNQQCSIPTVTMRLVTASFACWRLPVAFPRSPSTWTDSRQFGFAAIATFLGNRSESYFCGSHWWNQWQMSKFCMEMNVKKVKVCLISKVFSTAYRGDRPLGGYCAAPGISKGGFRGGRTGRTPP